MATPIPNNAALFTLGEIAGLTKGQLIGDAQHGVRGIQTDSRRVLENNLFVALAGERFDGHDFVSEASAKGASVLVSKRDIVPHNASAVVVNDTLRALGDLARAHRRKWGRQLIGVTGSMGKTTTKTLIAHALRATEMRAHASEGNLNNRIGLPMSIFQLSDEHDVAIMELGASVPGEIAQLSAIAEPNVGVVTAIGMAHGLGLGTLAAIADEKMSLPRAIPADGAIVLHGDSSLIRERMSELKARRIVTFGKSETCDLRLLSVEIQETGTSCSWRLGKRTLNANLRMIGEAAAMNVSAALATVVALERDAELALKSITTMQPVAGRMNLLRARNGALLIDDTYNANPDSMRAALDTAQALAQARKGPLIAILGDMRELGQLEAEAHRALGKTIAAYEVARFFRFGPAMEHASFVTSNAGIDSVRLMDPGDAAQALEKLDEKAVILVKGSRSMGMEKAVAALRDAEDTQV